LHLTPDADRMSVPEATASAYVWRMMRDDVAVVLGCLPKRKGCMFPSSR